MKKIILVFLSSFPLLIYAHGGASAIHNVRWTPVNIVAFPIALFNPGETEVRGILFSLGIGMSEKNVYGANLGIATLLTGECYGIAINVFSVLKENNGISLGIGNVGIKNNGIFTGIFTSGQDNVGISLGIINLWENNAGVLVGVFNYKIEHEETSHGVAIGVINISKKNTFQLGIYNQAEGGLQIGLLNHNPNALIPWMPFFNWSSPDTSKASKNN